MFLLRDSISVVVWVIREDFFLVSRLLELLVVYVLWIM